MQGESGYKLYIFQTQKLQPHNLSLDKCFTSKNQDAFTHLFVSNVLYVGQQLKNESCFFSLKFYHENEVVGCL